MARQIAKWLLSVVVPFAIVSVAVAEAPRLINYQGLLTDPDGTPIEGQHDVTFKIYTQETAGDSLWAQEFQDLALSLGTFSVILGPVPDDLFGASERWIEVTVDSDVISPRIQITSVPWAMRATVADSALSAGAVVGDGHSLDAADGDPVDVIYADSLGYVGVGTTDPTQHLDVNGTLRTTAFRLPTGASDGYVMTADSSGLASWQPNVGSRVPHIVYADQMPGTTTGQKIARACSLVTEAGGGLVDARGFDAASAHIIDVNVFADAGEMDLTLLFGNGTFHIHAPQQFIGGGNLSVLGQRTNTVLIAEGAFDIFHFNAYKVDFSGLSFDMQGMNGHAIFLEGASAWYPGVIEQIDISGAGGGTSAIKIGVNPEISEAMGTKVRDIGIMSDRGYGIEVNSNAVTIDRYSSGWCEAAVVVGTDNVNRLTLVNGAFDHNKHVLLIDHKRVMSITVASCRIENQSYSPGGAAISISGMDYNYPCTRVNIRDNYFTQLDSDERDGVYLEYVEGVVIEANQFAGDPGTGAESILFDDGNTVSEVFLAGNNTVHLDHTMSNYDLVGLPVNDIRVTQTSMMGAFGQGINVNDMITLTPRSSAPSDPVAGSIFIDANDNNKLKVYDGTQWQACW